jgi:hypothetical protein
METNYDLAIAYRIYPKVSKVPAIHSDNKYELSRVCLESFYNAVKKVKAYVYIILDGCPPEYKALFEKTLIGIDYEFIDKEGVGNAQTFSLQMDLLLSQDKSEVIYFAEDDYFYLDNAFSELLKAVKDPRVDFLTPYDHPDTYTTDFHNYKKEYLEIAGRKWGIMSSTTMTFMTTKKTLRETKHIFDTYTIRNYDASLWLSLTKLNAFNFGLMIMFMFTNIPFFKIYLKLVYFTLSQVLFGKKRILVQAVPALATHMEDAFLSHNINWYKEFEKHASE